MEKEKKDNIIQLKKGALREYRYKKYVKKRRRKESEPVPLYIPSRKHHRHTKELETIENSRTRSFPLTNFNFIEIISPPEMYKQYLLHKEEILIGRDESCDIRIISPNVSRIHARIVCNEKKNYYIEDLGSTNGLRVNGEIVAKHKLMHNDKFCIGDITFRFTSNISINEKQPND